MQRYKKIPEFTSFYKGKTMLFSLKKYPPFCVFNQLTLVGTGGQGDRGTAYFWLYTPFYTLTLCYSFIYEKQFLSLLILHISKNIDGLIYTLYPIKRGGGDKKSLSPCPPVPFMVEKWTRRKLKKYFKKVG